MAPRVLMEPQPSENLYRGTTSRPNPFDLTDLLSAKNLLEEVKQNG
jgi:hypothetical protein